MNLTDATGLLTLQVNEGPMNWAISLVAQRIPLDSTSQLHYHYFNNNDRNLHGGLLYLFFKTLNDDLRPTKTTVAARQFANDFPAVARLTCWDGTLSTQQSYIPLWLSECRPDLSVDQNHAGAIKRLQNGFAFDEILENMQRRALTLHSRSFKSAQLV